MERYAGLLAMLLVAGLVMPIGCLAVNAGGTVPAAGAGDGGSTDGTGGGGSADGGGGTGDPGSGDGGLPSEDDSQPGSDADTGGLPPDDGAAGGAVPPTVILVVSDTNPLPQTLITLNCLVSDAGGDPVTSFGFSSSAGSSEIQQDGGQTATALVPTGLFTITYTCRGTNQAGTGPDSSPVLVNTGG